MSSGGQLPYVSIHNTHGEEVIQWFPKSNDCSVTRLKYFIEDNLSIPERNQVLYHHEKEIYDSHIRQFDLLKLMKESTTPLKIHLAFKSMPTSNIDEKAEQSITKYHLQKLPAIPLKDAKYKVIVLENVFDHINYIKLVSTWKEKLKQILQNIIHLPARLFQITTPSKQKIFGGTRLEDLVIDDHGGIKQNFHIEVSLNPSSYNISNGEHYYFKVFGLKTLVLKTLTKVEKLDAYKYSTIQSIRTFVEKEYKIPRHLQILTHKQNEIKGDTQRLSDMFWENCSDEEKAEGAITFNLIAKPLNDM